MTAAGRRASFILAELEQRLGDGSAGTLDQARRQARLMCVRTPGDGRAHALSAVYEALAGETAAARRLAQRATLLAPDDRDVREICVAALHIGEIGAALASRPARAVRRS